MTQGAIFVVCFQAFFSFWRVSGTIKRSCSCEINHLITPICMEMGIDWPIGRRHIDLHHWKHSSSTNSEENKDWLNKRRQCAIKPIHVEQRKCASTKKKKIKKTTWAPFETGWMKHNVHASERSSRRILHFRIFHVTLLSGSISEASSSEASLKTLQIWLTTLLNNHLLARPGPLKRLIQLQTGATKTHVVSVCLRVGLLTGRLASSVPSHV